MDYSNTVATTLALLVVSWTIFSIKASKTDMSPAVLHNSVWALGLLIVGSGLMGYAPMSGFTWLLIASAIFCFNSGVAIAGVRSNVHLPKSSTFVKPTFLVTRRMYRILLLGFSIGFAVYLETIDRSFGLATLLVDPASIRSYSNISYGDGFPLYGKILFYFGPVCLVLTIFPRFVQGLHSRPLWWRLVILAYLAGAQIATLQRTNLFVGLVWAIGLLVLGNPHKDAHGERGKQKRKRIISLMVATVVALTVFQGLALALGKVGTNNPAINSAVDPRFQHNPALSVFYYASSGIPAFNKLTGSQIDEWPPRMLDGPVYGDYNPQTWGAATFAGPLKLIPGIPHWTEVAPFTFTPASTNVYTWLEGWYRDFRWVGVVFGSLITGIIIGSFAKRRYHNPETMLAASLLVGFTCLATFVNRYMSVMSVVIYLLLWVMGLLRRSREDSESRRDTGILQSQALRFDRSPEGRSSSNALQIPRRDHTVTALKTEQSRKRSDLELQRRPIQPK